MSVIKATASPVDPVGGGPAGAPRFLGAWPLGPSIPVRANIFVTASPRGLANERSSGVQRGGGVLPRGALLHCPRVRGGPRGGRRVRGRGDGAVRGRG